MKKLLVNRPFLSLLLLGTMVVAMGALFGNPYMSWYHNITVYTNTYVGGTNFAKTLTVTNVATVGSLAAQTNITIAGGTVNTNTAWATNLLDAPDAATALSALAGQPASSTLTNISTNTVTGTGTIPLSSVTDLLAPKADPTFTGSLTITNTTGTLLNLNGDSGVTWLWQASSNGVVQAGITNNGQLLLKGGSATYPSIGWIDDNDGSGSGFYRPGANRIGFAINGSPVGELKSTGMDLANGLSLLIFGETILSRESAGIVQIGADAASPVSYTVKGPDGSGTDKPGGSVTIEGGHSTGTATPGSVSIKRGMVGTASAATQNTNSTALFIPAKYVDLTESATTTLLSITCGTNLYVGATFACTVFASDGTEFQSLTSQVRIDAVDKAGTVTATCTQTDNTAAVSLGGSTLACTYTASGSTTNVILQANAVSSLAQTTLRCKLVATAINSSDPAVVTPQ